MSEDTRKHGRFSKVAAKLQVMENQKKSWKVMGFEKLKRVRTLSPHFINLPFLANILFKAHPKNQRFFNILPHYDLCKFPKSNSLNTFPNFLSSPIFGILRTTSLYKIKSKLRIQTINTINTIFLGEYFIVVVKYNFNFWPKLSILQAYSLGKKADFQNRLLKYLVFFGTVFSTDLLNCAPRIHFCMFFGILIFDSN